MEKGRKGGGGRERGDLRTRIEAVAGVEEGDVDGVGRGVAGEEEGEE